MSMPAGLQTSNILDAKYNMMRQRGQLKSEGGGFMRHQMTNPRTSVQQQPRRRPQNQVEEHQSVDIDRMKERY